MTEVYRRKPANGARVKVTLARYAPPLDRTAFEELRDVAEMADCDAEVQEVTFKKGAPVLLARYPYKLSDDEFTVTDYTEVEAGEYLAYSHAGRNLFAITDADLAEWYDKEDGARAS